MIAHVAEAGEGRGRVVLHLGPGMTPSETALDAAFKIAIAYNSEIESLFVENTQVLELSEFPFLRFVSLDGKTQTSCSRDIIERDFRLTGQILQRKVAELGRRQHIATHCKVIRDEPITALSKTCAESGPWNVVVLAEPLKPAAANSLIDILDRVHDTTGVVVAGPNAHRTFGPVVIIVEDRERLPGQLRAAQRLTTVTAGEIRVLLTVSNRSAEDADMLEAQVRLALADYPNVTLEPARHTLGRPLAIAEVIRRIKPGFVIARFGGLAVPRDDAFTLARSLESPLFLIR